MIPMSGVASAICHSPDNFIAYGLSDEITKAQSGNEPGPPNKLSRILNVNYCFYVKDRFHLGENKLFQMGPWGFLLRDEHYRK